MRYIIPNTGKNKYLIYRWRNSCLVTSWRWHVLYKEKQPERASADPSYQWSCGYNFLSYQGSWSPDLQEAGAWLLFSIIFGGNQEGLRPGCGDLLWCRFHSLIWQECVYCRFNILIIQGVKPCIIKILNFEIRP